MVGDESLLAPIYSLGTTISLTTAMLVV